MMKKDKKMSWREAFKINNRGMKLIFKQYPQMIISRFSYTIWTALSPYVGIYLSALIIEELTLNRNPERLKYLVLLTLISVALVSLITALLNKWQSIQNTGQFFKVDTIMNNKLLDMDYVDREKTETIDLLSRIYQNMNSAGWGFYRMIETYEELLNHIFKILGGISLTISLFVHKVPDTAGNLVILNNPLFVIGVIALMLLTIFVGPIFTNKAGSYFAKMTNEHNLANRLFGFFGWLGNNTELATDIRMYDQNKICEKYNKDKTGTFSSKGFFARLSLGPIGLYSALSSVISVIFIGLVYLFVCLKALGGAFGLGLVTQYVASITSVSGGLTSLLVTLGAMRNNASFISLVFEFLDMPNNMYQGSLTVEKRSDRKYQVEFKNVSFKYPGSNNYVLKNVNMRFEIGKRLAVVGMNGSGKTTFIKLLCRLYDPTAGEILLNGIDIRKYNYREYMDIFSVVFQDFNLFAFTLGENVGSKKDYNRELVIDSLNKTGFSERLNTLPDNVKTYLYTDYNKNGINISGGEAQKIALARALYKNAPFIILDEPTAALDPIAEAEIYEKFDSIVTDKTAIYISHRLSSCKFCDEILVFHEGEVVQQGSHNSLVLDKNGKYFELWNAQAQYYVDNKN